VKLTIVAALCSLQAICSPALAVVPNIDANLKKVLSWLPGNTQSLLVLNGPIKLPKVTNPLEGNATSMIPLVAVVPFTELSSQKFYPILRSRSLLFAIEALGPYKKTDDWTVFDRGFYVLSFENPAKWDDILKELEKSATSVSDENGTRIFAFPELEGKEGVYTDAGRSGSSLIGRNRVCLRIRLPRMDMTSWGE
jgi:hypothetical protein